MILKIIKFSMSIIAASKCMKKPVGLVMKTLKIKADNVFPTLFQIDLPIGKCVGVRISDSRNSIAFAAHELHPEEIEYSRGLKTSVQRTFLAGRIALRRSISLSNREIIEPILKDIGGAPLFPKGLNGSISHKGNIAIAVTNFNNDGCIGIDIEDANTKHKRWDIAKKVLTDNERTNIIKNPPIDGVTSEEQVLLRFSLKESAYKAINPYIRRYVGFSEAEVYPYRTESSQIEGKADIKLLLKEGINFSQYFQCSAGWFRTPVELFSEPAREEDENICTQDMFISWVQILRT